MRRRSVATVLVGPSVLLREGLTRILSPTPFRIVASVFHLNDVVWTLLSPHKSTLLILDTADHPDDDAAQIRLFKERRPSGRVAVLADHHRPADVFAAFQAGANVYLAKLASSDAFTKALELVMLGQTILPPELLSLIGARRDDQRSSSAEPGGPSAGQPVVANEMDRMPRLSGREKCILRCIVEGDSNKHIARKMSIAEATVKVHVKAILRKIQLHNRTQAAIWAVNNSSFLSRMDACPPLQAAMELPPLPALDTSSQSSELASLVELDQELARKSPN